MEIQCNEWCVGIVQYLQYLLEIYLLENAVVIIADRKTMHLSLDVEKERNGFSHSTKANIYQ